MDNRCVTAEILDGLAQDSPDAQASRRDIRIINRLVGTESWFRKILHKHRLPGELVLEVGAGDGSLGRTLIGEAGNLSGLDLSRRPLDWPLPSNWFQADVLEFNDWDQFPVVIGNLFFHHFDDAQLKEIGSHFRCARLIVASEPLRNRRALTLFSLLCPFIQAHPVTRYDGRVSIAAGFRDDELPHLLGLDPRQWRWTIHETWLGISRLVAERR